MKNCIFVLAIFLLPLSVFSQSSFTITSHNDVDMTWYQSYDRWAVFPDSTQSFRKIILHYDLGCATGGCSPWDYTTQIQLRHRTGEQDSNLVQQPTFTVNGNTLDSVLFNINPTYSTFYDTLGMTTDSIINSTMMIIVYNNLLNPTYPTDTILGFPTNYWNYEFDATGNIIDSTFINADSTWYITYLPYYNVFDVIETYELARVITPYGGNLPSTFSYTQDFDVTDFAKLLRDSVEIRAFYAGWSSGFSATLDFEFFPGIPAREVIDVTSLYRGDFGYSNSTHFETNYLPAKNVFIHPNTSTSKIRMTATGHGFDNNVYAAEFMPANYYVKTDGTLRFTKYNWDDLCGENPIYPDYETGSSYVHTWLYDRANWCPGTRAQIHQFDISPYITANDSININVDWQSFTWTGTQTPSYIIDCQLVQYEDANFSNDVELVEIISPSTKDEYSRLNPICSSPRVTIRNYGSTTLTSCDISYNVDGGATETYQWTGSLPFMDTISVNLPIVNIPAFWNTTAINPQFHATVSNPNGVSDEYAANNQLSSSYTTVPTYPGNLIINFRTNTRGSESEYRVYDGNGNIVFQRTGMSNSTVYNDTLELADGCYKFEMLDSGEDGLYFYYNASAGTGYSRLKNANTGAVVRNYKANFGSKYSEYFKVGYLFGNEEVISTPDVLIYPNPSQGIYDISVVGFITNEVKVEVYDIMGKLISTSNSILLDGQTNVSVDISDYADGIYIVRINGGSHHYAQQIIKSSN